jgi:hypothetical protein
LLDILSFDYTVNDVAQCCPKGFHITVSFNNEITTSVQILTKLQHSLEITFLIRVHPALNVNLDSNRLNPTCTYLAKNLSYAFNAACLQTTLYKLANNSKNNQQFQRCIRSKLPNPALYPAISLLLAQISRTNPAFSLFIAPDPA